jgi:hypothetical protein
MSIRTASEREAHNLVAWRRARLAESGFPLPLAARIARNPRFDLHELIELVQRGCGAELAVRILASLEREDAA